MFGRGSRDLVDKNLILVRERRWNGKVERFGIHDIVRESCLKVAEQEKFLGVLDSIKVIGPYKERRIVVSGKLSLLQPHTIGALQLPSLLRFLICQEVWFIDELLVVDLRLLRLSAYVNRVVLEKNYRYFSKINSRYLCFDVCGDWYPIPSSMSLLWNIQTLFISNVMFDISVPYEIWEMTQLRHLQFLEAQLLVDPFPGVINDQSNDQSTDQQKCIVLENLHTLLHVRNLRLTEEVCKRMPNIKNLSVSYFDRPGDCKASSSYYCPHNLGRLNKLESLKFVFGDDDYKWRDVVLSLVLPTSLEELSLQECHWEDLTKMLVSLTRLGSLELRQFRGPEWDLAEEELEFTHLKILKIFMCGDLICWNANSSHIPVLEILNMEKAPKLSEIPFDIGEIPTLRSIKLYECKVSAVSAMRIVVEQDSLGNEDLLLEVDFEEMEQVERFRTMVQEECLTTNSLHLSYRGDMIQ